MTVIGLDGVERLREAPLLNDIPARLRYLADQIESGEQKADFALVVIDGDSIIPDLFGFGNALDTRSILGMLDIAKDWFIRQFVADAEGTDD